MKHTIKIDIPWTEYSVKEYLWRPTQKHLIGKESATELISTEIDKIYDVINREIGARTGVYVPFPSNEYEEPQEAYR